MNQYIKNSGSFFIHTAFPADAIFRADVEVAFDSASHTNAPLVLYQEKSNNNQETDIYNMALATVIVAKAYQGQLPLIGKPAKIDETRCSLDKSIAEKYSVAKQLSDNQIQSFLEEFPIGQIF
ncbi:hypothetical protein HON01_10975 [Candidatus Woesearchaeota archaeon]|nr:hypothetical protein [Candidatus Woesearchaeota archaeon]